MNIIFCNFSIEAKTTINTPSLITILLASLVLVSFTGCKKENNTLPSETTPKEPVLIDEVVHLSEFNVFGTKWNSNNITYYFDELSNDISIHLQKEAFINAFQSWESISDLTFTEANNSSSADILISFEQSQNHSPCPSVFGESTLAHAFFPPPNVSLAGDIHMNDLKTWDDNDGFGTFDMETVALHEIGHSLGLEHSDVEEAVMFPYYGGENRSLHQDDIEGINTIYPPTSGGGDNLRLTGDMDFGNVMIGSQRTSTLTIENLTNSNLNVFSIGLPNGFSSSWTGDILAGQFVDVDITFAPDQPQLYNGQLTVEYNPAPLNGSESIPVSGTGVQDNTGEIETIPSIGNWVDCPTQTINGTGDCIGIHYANTIRFRASQASNNEVTFEVARCNPNSIFNSSGNVLLREDDYCGDIIEQKSYSAGTSSISIEVSINYTGSRDFYCIIESSSGSKFYGGMIAISK